MKVDPSAEQLDASGPWPFITRRSYRLGDASEVIWRSRHHRKGLCGGGAREAAGSRPWTFLALWMPRKLNWWIGVLFAVGAALFMLGCLLILAPSLVGALPLEESDANPIFFAGSVPFTAAAYFQLYQSANAGEGVQDDDAVPKGWTLFGWFPHRIGWLSCALQFVGTLLFNINTLDAMIPGLNWFQQDIAIWVPNIVGSTLFLTAGYLAFAETCHAHFAWKPGSLSWWITWINLLGCMAFMISASFAFVPPHPLSFDAGTVSVAFTLVGALGFFVGSLLMLPETAKN